MKRISGQILNFLLTKFIHLYCKIVYISCLLSVPARKDRKEEFPEFDFWLIRILRNMLGTVLNQRNSGKGLRNDAWKLRYNRVIESGLFMFGLKFPGLLIYYVRNILYPGLSSHISVQSNKSSVFLVHNFCGARITILAVIMYCVNINRNISILADDTAISFCRQWLMKLKKPFAEVSGQYLKVDLSQIIKNSGLELTLLDHNNLTSIRMAIRGLKDNKTSLVFIPESDRKIPGKLKVPFMNKELNLSSASVRFSRLADTIVDIIPDCRENMLIPELAVNQTVVNNLSESELTGIIVSGIVKYEQFVFHNPFLFVPFDFANLWNDLNIPDMRESTPQLLCGIERRKKHLTLWSDGNVFIMNSRQFRDAKEILSHQ